MAMRVKMKMKMATSKMWQLKKMTITRRIQNVRLRPLTISYNSMLLRLRSNFTQLSRRERPSKVQMRTSPLLW